MINRAKLQHILEYSKQQRHIGIHCKVPPEDMVEIVEAAMLQGAENAESRCTIQAAPVLGSSPKNAELRCSNSPVVSDGWVACSERMPEQFVEVLACTEDGGRYVAALNQSMTWDDGDFFDGIHGVTHWQPLPSPPAK